MCLETPSEEPTIFLEVPPDAVSTSANVNMHYAIITSGPFTLPEGYQFGSPVVYIYYDSRHVTKPLKLKLPHWYGGENHTRDGLSFAVAPHSLKEGSVYLFQLLAGGKFPVSSHCGVLEIHGHCSLYAEVFKLGPTLMYLATFLVKGRKRQNRMRRCSDVCIQPLGKGDVQSQSSVNTPLFIHVICSDWFLCLYVFCIDIEAEVQTWVEFVKDCSIPIQV